jgi:ketosteroid isomerase-like protein
MKRLFAALAVVAALVSPVLAAPEPAPAAAELTQLLKDFLAGASRNDAAMHDRFWAEDLVYTGSVGRRVGKADILKDVRATPAPGEKEPPATYAAEDVRIQQYGDAAVVAFRLVATTKDEGKTTVAQFFNTGTFVKRDGQWRAVAWQATRIPEKTP